ncbi:hypothetical protein T05_2101 [Trichinella murrelli]|uniref:Uncharacterized protein n=1 Tax=Trichinella murrelli TaxID=144512 RepID=A0A0V0TZX4_9BILA|nr:hypothetical protein T05_13547 [Trichinella murrelli]KRX45808.1 hypothetical protein T05_2101 [Trichinella murrelli]
MALNFILNTTTTIRIAIKERLVTVGSEDEKYLTSFVAGSAVSNSILSIISQYILYEEFSTRDER